MPPQQHLFDTEPEPWEADDQAEQLVATVVFSTGPGQEFDYLVPDALREQVEPGRRVARAVGQGNRLVDGLLRAAWRPGRSGRGGSSRSHDVLDQRSLLSPAMLRLTQWIADYYLCDWATVLEAVVPAGVRGKAGTRMTTLLERRSRKSRPDWRELKLPPKQAGRA